ncbi:hypothetical protein RJ640_009798, partial [Escallonia rubra]
MAVEGLSTMAVALETTSEGGVVGSSWMGLISAQCHAKDVDEEGRRSLGGVATAHHGIRADEAATPLAATSVVWWWTSQRWWVALIAAMVELHGGHLMRIENLRNSKKVNDKVRELQISLKASLEFCAAERQGRIRAQQDLRKALVQPNFDKLESPSYPMTAIAIIQSCFSTRNGTPRQPLLVPLARACLIFDPARVPPASLEGLEGYSHCWIIYVFHLNTNLDKLWKHPSKSKFKAKVRVPRLRGEKVGVFATRSPHRRCPIGLTVAKVEAVQGHKVLLSGVDLVDGTPVLDVKPYLPYCDSIQGATVPKWIEVPHYYLCYSTDIPFPLPNNTNTPTLKCLQTYMQMQSLCSRQYIFLGFLSVVFPMLVILAPFAMKILMFGQDDDLLAVATVNFTEGFSATLADCWTKVRFVCSFDWAFQEKKSLYSSADEFRSLIGQVLNWDIRSLSQRSRPTSLVKPEEGKAGNNNSNSNDYEYEEASDNGNKPFSPCSGDITYHLILEGLNVAYRIDCRRNVLVEEVILASQIQESNH